MGRRQAQRTAQNEKASDQTGVNISGTGFDDIKNETGMSMTKPALSGLWRY